MNKKIDILKILNREKTADEELIYYYLAYSSEKDETKKLLLLKKLQELRERSNQDD